MNSFNHIHCHVFYCKQLPCGEILTAMYYSIISISNMKYVHQ